MTHLEVIVQAIAEHKGLNMSYQKPSSDRPMDRTILPYLLIENGYGRQYVWAYDALREDARTFRVDRIKAVNARGKPVEIAVYHTLAKGTKLEAKPCGGTIIAEIN